MTSALQATKQVRQIVRETAWPDGATEKVVGDDTYIVPANDKETPEGAKYALITIGAGRPDPDDPQLIEQDIILGLFVSPMMNDPLGEKTVTGGTRARGKGSSAGRGLLEIERPILERVSLMTGADGVGVQVAATSLPELQAAAQEDGVVLRAYLLTMLCTVDDRWPAPSELVCTPAAGQITIAWTLPPDLYSFKGVVVRYAQGAVAPASATAGTDVPVAAPLTDTQVVLSGLAADDYSVAVFAKFSETGDTTASELDYSPQETGTTRLSITVP